MKFESTPKLSIMKVLPIVVPAITIGLGAYYFLESIVLGVLVFAIVFIVTPIVKGRKLNKNYKNYIAKFGYDFSAEYSPEIYESSIYGFVPSANRYVHCSIYVNAKGIIVSKKAVKRCILWDTVVGYQLHSDEKSKYIELNITDLSTENRLLIPWAKEFSCFLPKNS